MIDNTKHSGYYVEATRLSISDACFAISLENVQEFNFGDNAYVKENDNGAFITGTDMRYSGYSSASQGGNPLAKCGGMCSILPYDALTGFAEDVLAEEVDYFFEAIEGITNEITSGIKSCCANRYL